MGLIALVSCLLNFPQLPLQLSLADLSQQLFVLGLLQLDSEFLQLLLQFLLPSTRTLHRDMGTS